MKHVNKKVKKISGVNETKEEDEKEEDSMDILNKNIHFLTNLSYLSFSSIIYLIIDCGIRNSDLEKIANNFKYITKLEILNLRRI